MGKSKKNQKELYGYEKLIWEHNQKYCQCDKPDFYYPNIFCKFMGMIKCKKCNKWEGSPDR